jgi:hypothetical protein
MKSEWFMPILFVTLAIGMLVFFWICIIRGILQRRRDKEEARQQCRDAREKIMADGKIEGPKGPYKPKRWASKWVGFSNGLPAPRAQSRFYSHFPEMPSLPSRKDD